jgi:hypothetical protein
MALQQLDFVGYEAVTNSKVTDSAIARAVDHADAVSPMWSSMAYGALLAFAATEGKRFTSEDVRACAEYAGLPTPPDPRAWGGVFRRAARAGKIRRVGFGEAQNAQAHSRPVAQWLLVSA